MSSTKLSWEVGSEAACFIVPFPGLPHTLFNEGPNATYYRVNGRTDGLAGAGDDMSNVADGKLLPDQAVLFPPRVERIALACATDESAVVRTAAGQRVI